MSEPRPRQTKDVFKVDVDAAVASFWRTVELHDKLLAVRGIVITGAGRAASGAPTRSTPPAPAPG
jgi:hypothetical protein